MLALVAVRLDATLRSPGGWRLTLDGQYAHNTARYRGLAGADAARWQQLVDAGLYEPFRDTQVQGPSAEFYDRVLIHYGKPGSFVTLGDYTTLDTSARLTHSALPLPTGPGVLNLGVDYRRTQLEDFRDERRYGDGALAATPGQELTYTCAPPGSGTRIALDRELKFDSHISLTSAFSDMFTGWQVYNSSIPPRFGAESWETDALFNKIRTEVDQAKREPMWRQLGDIAYSTYMNIPLFWLPAEVSTNPKVVADWVFPGSITGTWTHIENLKAVK